MLIQPKRIELGRKIVVKSDGLPVPLLGVDWSRQPCEVQARSRMITLEQLVQSPARSKLLHGWYS